MAYGGSDDSVLSFVRSKLKLGGACGRTRTYEVASTTPDLQSGALAAQPRMQICAWCFVLGVLLTDSVSQLKNKEYEHQSSDLPKKYDKKKMKAGTLLLRMAMHETLAKWTRASSSD